MAVIKLNASGQVILRGGLPSCTCCGTTLYVEHREFPYEETAYEDAVVSRFSMVGTVGAGFTGDGPGGEFTLVYSVGIGEWVMTDPVYGVSQTSFGTSPTNPLNPSGTYYDASFWAGFGQYIATVSLTPFIP